MKPGFLNTSKTLNLTKKPLLMGILNVTPDSFSDGGKYFKLDTALKHTQDMINQGVDIIDVGGESTRPGAKPVSEEEELNRVIPVIKEISLLATHHLLLISVDTYKSNVAKLALDNGANMINDVSGLTMDENMVKVAREANCPIVIMHNRGIPATKPENEPRHCEGSLTPLGTGSAISKTLGDCRVVHHGWTPRNDITEEVYTWLKNQTDFAIRNGVKKENIIIDPGIGFGKSPEEDLILLENLKEFESLGFPVLAGPSKKSFIRRLFPNHDLKIKSKEMIELAIKNGASIVRIHL